MSADYLGNFQAQIEEINRLLDEHLRASLRKTETEATVDIAMTLFSDGWQGSIRELISAARRLSGGQP